MNVNSGREDPLARVADVSSITAILILSGPIMILVGLLFGVFDHGEWAGLMAALGIFLIILVAASYGLIWAMEKI